jgi:hypothetical protein
MIQLIHEPQRRLSHLSVQPDHSQDWKRDSRDPSRETRIGNDELAISVDRHIGQVEHKIPAILQHAGMAQIEDRGRPRIGA